MDNNLAISWCQHTFVSIAMGCCCDYDQPMSQLRIMYVAKPKRYEIVAWFFDKIPSLPWHNMKKSLVFSTIICHYSDAQMTQFDLVACFSDNISSLYQRKYTMLYRRLFLFEAKCTIATCYRCLVSIPTEYLKSVLCDENLGF